MITFRFMDPYQTHTIYPINLISDDDEFLEVPLLMLISSKEVKAMGIGACQNKLQKALGAMVQELNMEISKINP